MPINEFTVIYLVGSKAGFEHKKYYDVIYLISVKKRYFERKEKG